MVLSVPELRGTVAVFAGQTGGFGSRAVGQTGGIGRTGKMI